MGPLFIILHKVVIFIDYQIHLLRVSLFSGSKEPNQVLALSNVQVSGFNTGIYLGDIWKNVSLLSSDINSANTGVFANGGGNMDFSSNKIASNNEHGISFYYFRGTLEITDSVFDRNMKNAILVNYGYHNNEEIRLSVSNSTISGNLVGFLFNKASRSYAGDAAFDVNNNVFTNNEDAILNTVGNYYNPKYKLDFSFSGNVVKNNTRGITYQNQNYKEWHTWNISRNTFESSSGHLMKIKGSGSIDNNEFQQATCGTMGTSYGELISITATDHLFQFTENNIHDNSMCVGLVRIESDSTLSAVNSNRFQNNKVSSFILHLTATNPTTNVYKQEIKDNILEGNKATLCGNTRVITLTGTRETVVTGNILDNANLTYELRNELYTVNDTLVTDASLNYWGTETAKEILERIWDGRRKIWRPVSKYSPFYINRDRSDTATDTFEVGVVKEEYMLSGRMSKSVTLSKTDNSYILESDLVVSRGLTLTIKEGVTLLLTPQTNLVVNGQLDVQGTELNPVVIDTVVLPDKGCSNKYILRLSGGTKTEGILEYLHEGLWYPFCVYEWTAENTRTACTQLGLGTRM